MEDTKITKHNDELKIATRIKELRNQLGITQKEFVQNLSMTAATLSAYEKRTVNPSITAIIEIAKKYDVSVDWLLGLRDSNPKEDTIETYTDVLNLVVKLTYAANKTAWIPCEIAYDGSQYILRFICNTQDEISDEIQDSYQSRIYDLLSQYSKALDLYLQGIIDNNIFNAVMEKLQKDFNIDFEEALLNKKNRR